VPKHHGARLLKLGYIREVTGQIALADAGWMRLAPGQSGIDAVGEHAATVGR
jgi:hypothetical protein